MLLAVVTCVAVLALGAASAQALPAHRGTSSASPATVDPASIDSESVSNVTATGAQLSAEINPSGAATTCEFQYIDDTDFHVERWLHRAEPRHRPLQPGESRLRFNRRDGDRSDQRSDTGHALRLPRRRQRWEAERGGRRRLAVLLGSGRFDRFGVRGSHRAAGLPAWIRRSTPRARTRRASSSTSTTPTSRSTWLYRAERRHPAVQPLGSRRGNERPVREPHDHRADAKHDLRLRGGGDEREHRAKRSTRRPHRSRRPRRSRSTPSPSSGITSTTATLNAQLNPNGLDTTYQFVVTGPGSFNETVPANPVDIGCGTTDVGAAASLSGLTPGTTYTYHVTATNSAGTSDRKRPDLHDVPVLADQRSP